MSWISIILLIIQYGPAIFNLVVEIIELIKKYQKPNPVAAKTAQLFLKSELKNAVKTYRATRDRRPLYALRDKLRKEIYG